MGSFSLAHWIIVLIVVLILFGGRSRISNIMKEIGTGIRYFRQGLKGGNNNKDKKQDED